MRYFSRNTIYRILSLLLLCSMAAAAQARLYRDPSDGYWIISTAEDLNELAHDPTIWDKKVKQIADIDFQGGEMIPIGSRTRPFSGEYDGLGHTIKNLRIYWDFVNSEDVAFGLFCYVNGSDVANAKLHNIVLENVSLTRRVSGSSYSYAIGSNDIKLGLLAGAVAPYVDIQNVLIDGCRIDDGCFPGQKISVHGVFAGGAVGDFASEYGKYAQMEVPPGYAFRNIVVTNTVIDLNNVVNGIDRYQFHVGGIVGRMRKPRLGHIPENTVFSGSISAKMAYVSPVVACSRVSDFSSATQIASYACEVTRPDGTVATVYDCFGSDTQGYTDFCSSRVFFDYKAFNSNTNALEEITESYPDPGASYMYGTRTFRPNSPYPAAGLTSDVKTRAYLQGVSFGRLAEAAADGEALESMLQADVQESRQYHWDWDGSRMRYIRDFDIDRYDIGIFDDPVSGCLVAKLVYKGTKNFIDTPISNVNWYSRPSLDSGDWMLVADAVGQVSITPDRSLFYRVDWTDDNGVLHVSDYFVPTTVVYVFNRETNDAFNSRFDTSATNPNYEAIYSLDSTLYPTAGDDENDGLTPETAVLTMHRAYGVLNKYGSVKTNKIVVMGYYEDPDYLNFDSYGRIVDAYNIPATVTGTDNATIAHGTLGFDLAATTGSTDTREYRYLSAPLKLSNIDFAKSLLKTNSYVFFLVCNFFDLTVDENVRFINFGNYAKNYGLPEDIQSVPYLTLVGGTQDCDLDPIASPITYPSDLYPDRPNMYSEPGFANITVRSGCFGRIICCGRNVNEIHTLSKNITGSYLVPNRVRLNVDFADDIDYAAGREFTKYGLKIVSKSGKYHYESAKYSHNIGLIAGGQTDGSTYADVNINIFSGHVARVITGNITYGRLITIGGKEVAPSDSYFGRASLSIYGKLSYDEASGKYYSPTTVNEVFGGMLGRLGDSTSGISPYFYGRSEINMYGGYIGPYQGSSDDLNLDNLKLISPSLYGAGSGGVAGLGDDFHHTSDQFIPYLTASGGVEYKPFDPNLRMPVMDMADGSVVDLNNTECHVNLYGGIIQGNVFGAGYGYSNNIQDYKSGDGKHFMPSDIGVLYGHSYVTMQKHPDYQPAVVLGNVYGSGSGDNTYARLWAADHRDADPDDNPYLAVAAQYGDTHMLLQAGTIGDFANGRGGDVFGGAMGIPGYKNIAALYGNTNLSVDGVTIYGNIYGGSELANINVHPNVANTGNTRLNILSGVIGNCIFGGSKGIDALKDTDYSADSKAVIQGSTYVNVHGGDFLDYPYIKYNQPKVVDGRDINIVTHRGLYRTFNIYGGGFRNCDVAGDANVTVTSSLLWSENSFPEPEENANRVVDSHTDDESHSSRFHSAYMDITFRSFSVYGGGYGEKTNVLNTNVHVTIPEDRADVTLPHGNTLTRFLDHQSFFDISGGGYSGDVGYWANDDGMRVDDLPELTLDNLLLTPSETGTTLTDEEKLVLLDNQKAAQYDHYVGGNCNVVIDGYTYARKVVGGGFYGSCNTTNTHVRCGSLRQVYGGSLLGYVHKKAYLQFGNRVEDFIETLQDGSYTFSHNGTYSFAGNVREVLASDPALWDRAAARAKQLNRYIFITENIYGGNDVKGIIGTTKWRSPEGRYGIDQADGGPLYQTDVSPSEDTGIVFNIYGGTFMGDVYSAGNGHYRGYYVPEWVRYDDGPDRMYRTVRSSLGGTNPDGSPRTGKAYRSRPMVGSVNVNLRGNSADDVIDLRGNFFGGGRECTIGQFNTFLPLEDPRRLVQGGHLHVNFGGHVHIDGNLYLGSEGSLYAEQHTVPEGIDVATFDGSTTAELSKLGDTAYDHWYYNDDEGDEGCYVPGFPLPGKVDGNFGMRGEHMFRGYMKNIEMEGDVELTFYRYIYERGADGQYVYVDRDAGIRKRRHWIPGEKAMAEYDAPDVRINSFFLGGLCGSMTNNNVMIYDYAEDTAYDEDNPPATGAHDLETWGSVYRVALPAGVTVRENVVMGSQNATVKIDEYTPGYHGVDKSKNVYTFEGGIVTHSGYGFDLIVYNDVYHNTEIDSAPWRDLPDDFYTSGTYLAAGVPISSLDQHTMTSGVTIYRANYAPAGHFLSDISVAGQSISDRRYGLAVTADGSAFIGRREKRRLTGTADGTPLELKDKMTVSKLTLGCKFDLMGDHSDLQTVYGGNVYGGCYNSGLVIGDVVLNVGSNLLGGAFEGASRLTASEYSALGHNIGRVFGGGYGSDTRMDGDTYVNLLRNFRGMNVFGGGMMGDVTGTSNITYVGSETGSMVYGAIYGGGLRGAIGTPGVTEQATTVRLFSGNVNAVYGGSCMGDLYGRTFVELCDEVTSELSHFNYKRFLDNTSYEDWGTSRLIAGSVYGGNDIAGNIYPLDTAAAPPASPSVEDSFRDYSTGVYIHEIQSVDSDDPVANPNGSKTSPGAVDGYNGFPLVGNLYGGSNGDYGLHDATHTSYAGGKIVLATGVGTDTIPVKLAGEEGRYGAFSIPNIESAQIVIGGGSVINAYGGGDMATITGKANIAVDYPQKSLAARAGFESADELDRVWSVLHLSANEQRDEVSRLNGSGQPIFDFQIFRLFGGNNNADMAIQPDWDLQRGFVGSLYSGGNFGMMTYFQPETPAVAANPSATPPVEAQDAKPELGLTLTVDSPDINVDYVYGGGRVGDVNPAIPDGYTVSDDFYGATLNIRRGIIEHVYGGNDVAGYIHYGTQVNITGAISGDVYCAGNGNYFYRYDRDASLLDYSSGVAPRIKEDYEFDNPAYPGSRFFVLPAKAEYGFDGSGAYSASDALTVMAINSYRPHVERAKLYIAGSEDNYVWVRGKVYCGGNSSSIVPKTGATRYDVKFDIGSYVTLNGVYMGSNGEMLANGESIQHMEQLNALNGADLMMTGPNDLDLSQLPPADADVVNLKASLYPKVLDLYMRAVEVVDKPEDFHFSPDLKRAYIGEFCVGGNRGSMMTDKKIALEFPPTLTIFGKIIGGCMDSNVTYNGVTHIGGLTMPLDTDAPDYDGRKVHLKVKSRFLPLFINYPDTQVTPPISIRSNFVDGNGNSIMEYNSADNSYEISPDYLASGKNYYYANEQCNIFGGCLTSGTTIGDVDVEVYSDMLNYDGRDESYAIDKRVVLNGMIDKSWRSFTVVGGGYGSKTAVHGNVHVSMLPTPQADAPAGKASVDFHPSAASLFGGSQEGLVVGSTTVELRDGKVFANLYGASEAAPMYGSTHVIVGYPKYYRVKKSGIYGIYRIDYLSDVAKNGRRDEKGKIVVTKSVGLHANDLVAANVYDNLYCRMADSAVEGFEIGAEIADTSVDGAYANRSEMLADCFELVESATTSVDHMVPADYGVDWDDIVIWVGDQASNSDPDAEYYGQGNIYGGGYVPNSSDRSLVGEYTVLRYTPDFNRGASTIGFGGNTSVMVWDNSDNADLTFTDVRDNVHLKDHVHVATGRFKQVPTRPNGSQKGLYRKHTVNGNPAYVYQTSGRMADGAEYYEKEADGGLYGAGRKVFVEGFTSIDLAYYGYAEHSPQLPKILNTIQRADMVRVTDCCIDLVGASDFTVEQYKDIYYAINRVGELRMESSLDYMMPLDQGYVDTSDGDGVRVHSQTRSRNYMALYNKTNHMGAFRSNWNLDRRYHDDEGRVTTLDDPTYGYYWPLDDLTPKESYVNHKHRYIDLYDQYFQIKKQLAAVDNVATVILSHLAEISALKASYEAFSGDHVGDIPAVPTPDQLMTVYNDLGNNIEEIFRHRNVGTSANMIGISSGYELSVEGLACQLNEDTQQVDTKESRYYGPAFGVTEIKLLTTVSGMGGGYVYALNHHYDKDTDADAYRDVPAGWCSKFGAGEPTFLQTTGNFVFPGASYLSHNDGKDETKHNYIIDDCFDHFDPINHGYYACDLHDRVIIRMPADDGATPPAKHVNKSHEVHYWYVSGNTYVYNVTVTGITSDTSPESPRPFYASSESELFNLFNVKAGTDIKVTDVTWFEHDHSEFPPGGDCDLADMAKQYQLYLTIDHNVRNDYSNTDDSDGEAYVLRIPRVSYEIDIDESTGLYTNRLAYTPEQETDYAFSTSGAVIDPNPGGDDFTFLGTYTDDHGKTQTNTPRLGVRLLDGQRNRLADEDRQAGIDYYNNHLKPDHYVQVTLETQNGNDEPIIYVINIDIHYLMGPALFGQIDIENCALPGEYIYVNAEDVEVLMDENLGVASQKWRIYPNDAQGRRIIPDGATEPVHIDIDPKTENEYSVADNERLIHIPAYYYMDGWEVAFRVTANGEEMESTLPFYAKKRVPDPADESKTILVDDTDNPIYDNRLHVHNYHRMRPIYNGQVLDLRLVPGARVYLENQADMHYFFEYLHAMQCSDSELADYTSAADPALKYLRKAPGGVDVNPRYCEGIDFYMQGHFSVPVVGEYTHGSDPLDLKGSYHGNGHWMIIPEGANINMVNSGSIYNTGFVSNMETFSSAIFEQNHGLIQNCFYFNEFGNGKLTVPPTSATARVVNCYQNTPVDEGFSYDQLLELSSNGFRYGQAAYNLNGFYLEKRHKLLHRRADGTLGKVIDNNSFELAKRDSDIRADLSLDPYDFAVGYIERMFNNGDYRYAMCQNQLSVMGSQFTEALRTAESPNYFDRLSLRGTDNVSKHKYTHDVDTRRWCDRHKEYHPIFDTDYLFFGEDLMVDVDHTNTNLPELYTPETRVYRVGGFYGSKADKGYFLNLKAYVDAPLMTAIDFVGYRDREMYEANGDLKADYRAAHADGGNGWIINDEHQVYMAPTIDVPWVQEAGGGVHTEFEEFSINSDRVTHNLLIYTHDNDHARAVMDAYHYYDKSYDLGRSLHSFAEHDEAAVTAHHILDTGVGSRPMAHAGMMHLVDAHDFNAPVAFDVNEAWYVRQPHDYADEIVVSEPSGNTYAYKTAWEGICLPFDVMKTYAASTDFGTMRDMGEITHFFGSETKDHEYWLRRYTGTNSDGHLVFERPTADNQALPAGEDRVADYLYTNTAIYDMYTRFEYNADHDDLYHVDDDPTTTTEETLQRTIKDYRHLSHNVPYVAAYPGRRYYEFDLSGEFYCQKNDKVIVPVPQTVTYFANGVLESTDRVTIPVTDDTGMVEYDRAGYTVRGTFKHVTNDVALAKSVLYDKVLDLAVLDACDVKADGSLGAERHEGELFRQKAASESTVVLPFRVYLTTGASAAAPSTGAPLRIGSRSALVMEDIVDDDVDPGDLPADDSKPAPGVEVWVEGRSLVIKTPYDLETSVYDTSGRTVRRIRAYEGVNRYSGLPSGLYIVLRTKCLIK